MKSYEDLLNIKNDGADLKGFIKDVESDWKSGELYTRAQEAKLYNEQENTAINSRRFVIPVRKMIKDQATGKETIITDEKEIRYRANNAIANGLFHKLITQKTQFLLGDGISLDPKIKEKLGTGIDRKTQQAGIDACLCSVSWAYGYLSDKGSFEVDIFEGDSVIPLISEETGVIAAAIRFYELGIKNIKFYEVYEPDGMTRYKAAPNKEWEVAQEKQAYVTQRLVFKNDAINLSELNIDELPLVPFYNNKGRTSDFKKGLKSQLDLYDIIFSDFGNNLEDNKDVYWVLKNYKTLNLGSAAEEFFAMLESRVIDTGEDSNGGAEPHQIEVPHEAREKALTLLRQQIISDYMGLDLETIRGGSLTNVAIMAAYGDLDLKVSEFEWGALDFVKGIIQLYGKIMGETLNADVGDFNRRTLVNDTEVIANLAASPELSLKTRIKKHPYAAPDELDRIAAEDKMRLEVDDEDDEDDEEGALNE